MSSFIFFFFLIFFNLRKTAFTFSFLNENVILYYTNVHVFNQNENREVLVYDHFPGDNSFLEFIDKYNRENEITRKIIHKIYKLERYIF